MSAELLQSSTAAVQRFNQVKTFDTAPTALSDAVCLEPDHNRRPMIFPGNSRRDNSQHARMPLACPHDNCRITHRIKLASDLLLGGKQDLLFNFLPRPILLVEKISERGSFHFILCEKKLQRLLSCAQSSCRVQSRSKPESDIFR